MRLLCKEWLSLYNLKRKEEVEEDEGIVLAHFAGRAKWNRARNHAGGEQEEVEKGRGRTRTHLASRRRP